MATFKSIAKHLNQNDYMVVFGTLASLVMGIIGAALMWADFNSSRLGVESLGLREAIPYESFFVAGVLQSIQVAIIYVAGNKTLNIKLTRLLLFIYVIALACDWGTDTYHKAYGYDDISTWVVAGVYSALVFVVGSELLFVFGWSIFMEIAPDGIGKFGQFLGRLWDLLAAAFQYLFGEGEDDNDQMMRGGQRPGGR